MNSFGTHPRVLSAVGGMCCASSDVPNSLSGRCLNASLQVSVYAVVVVSLLSNTSDSCQALQVSRSGV